MKSTFRYYTPITEMYVYLNFTRENASDSGSRKFVIHLTPVKLGNKFWFLYSPGPLSRKKFDRST